MPYLPVQMQWSRLNPQAWRGAASADQRYGSTHHLRISTPILAVPPGWFGVMDARPDI
ncbi:hypothetical protein AB4156_29390 [Cupriavidus sp. 2MCAB6]|uniref:hypothetical protein n=1 Tax=Cupriavidus sp. 2MCAB6 TaxID=3232981 RepID=UPI003F8E8D9A